MTSTNKASRILIVDDNVKNLQVIGKILQDEGHQVELSTNGEGAIEWLHDSAFDLVLLDINMPGMDGFEVCRQIRSKSRYDNLPVIFLTAAVERDHVLRGFELGAQDYITKPFDSRELIMRVNTHLHLKHSMEELAHLNQTLEEKVRDRTRELLDAKNKAEESNRLKSHFLMNVSHEIRTPMNGILGFTSLLQHMNLKDDQKDQYISIIHKSGQRLLDTVNDLIEMSLIQTESIVVKNAETDIVGVLSYLFDFFEPQAKEKDIDMHCPVVATKTTLDFLTDKRKLEAILAILIKNAIKFTEKGSVEFGYSDNHDSVVFYVKDTGVGIPADRQEAIFDRFVQADLEITRDQEGMGLGLSIAKAYTEALGGKIWLDSAPGKGSAFFLSLPRNPAGR